jgi:hypothetical protein
MRALTKVEVFVEDYEGKDYPNYARKMRCVKL